MICPFCNKNEATIHYTEVTNGKMEETHMCEQCAEERGIETSLPFSFGDILTALTKGLESMHHAEDEELLANPACSSCGQTMRGFVKHGRLGCANCYEAFDQALKDITRSVQKSQNHVGKVPKVFPRSEDTERRVAELETELRKAVNEERYEECVSLRDEIKRLKQALEESKNA